MKNPFSNMNRRSTTLLISSVAAAGAIAASVLIPVPYVILGPGPTLNTLGKDSSGQPLITIKGHPEYPTTGHLNMVTVSYAGGPGNDVNIYSALAAWLNPQEAVVPESELFPPGSSQQQVQQQNTTEMTTSQQVAVAAALTELHIPYKTENQVAVAGLQAGFPADSVVKVNDVITAVDGQPVTTLAGLQDQIRAHPAGTTLTITVDRSGKTLQLQAASKEYNGHPALGVQVQMEQNFTFPFTVHISVGDIGGPSAGTMFALGIIDKLTNDDLAGGKFIAGTGEISTDGAVGAIGGIQQKMVGARNAGATVFLTPASNCADTKGAVPAGLQIVKIATLNQAVQDLEAIKNGKSVPSC